jgi:hypothetical protein
MIGGSSARISVVARLISAGEPGVAVIDPAEVHYRTRPSPLAGTKKEALRHGAAQTVRAPVHVLETSCSRAGPEQPPATRRSPH